MIPAAPPAGLPGDPAELRAAAHSLGGAASVLSDQAVQLMGAAQSASYHWVGAASTMWTELGTRHHGQLTTAAGALRDAAGTLDEYANRLEEAQRAQAVAGAQVDALTRHAIALAAQPPGQAHAGDLAALHTDIGRAARAGESAVGDARAAAHVAAAHFHAIAARAPRDLQACPAPPTTSGSAGQAPSEPGLALLLGSVRSGSAGQPVELDLQDPVAVRGASRQSIGEVARAQGWESKPATKGGGGTVYFKPGTNDSDGIRVMDGDPKALAVIKQGPYAMITRHGVKTRVPLEGNRVLDEPGQGPGPWATGQTPPGAEPQGPVEAPGAPLEPVAPVEPVVPEAPVEPIVPEILP